MPRINSLTVSVRLGRDVARKELGGKLVAECSGAFDMGFGDRKTTGWLDVQLWGRVAEMFADDCGTGDEVVLAGRLEMREWEGREGKRQTWGIVASDYLVTRKRAEQEQRRERQDEPRGRGRDDAPPPIEDEDLPF